MSQPKLLLADDSLTIQKVVSLTFADRGIDVISFADGDAAVEHLDAVNPDIVLADVHMPGINGYGLCELIRSNESTKDLPVVLLVGSFEPFDRDEAERVGANTHLTKPFTAIADVVATVERLLGESKPEQSQEPPPLLPDTTDIDSLYERSVSQQHDISQAETVEFDMDVLDDEMIQTSYAEPDLNSEIEESLYVPAGEDDTPVVEVEEDETESLIAESLSESAEPDPAAHYEEGAATTEDADPAPQPVQHSDPFESVAGEPPPVQTPPAHFSDSIDLGLGDDLLEIPGSRSAGIEYTVPGAPAANGREAVSLSPELVDLIVQKVLDKLAEQDRGDEARSVSGS